MIAVDVDEALVKMATAECARNASVIQPGPLTRTVSHLHPVVFDAYESGVVDNRSNGSQMGEINSTQINSTTQLNQQQKFPIHRNSLLFAMCRFYFPISMPLIFGSVPLLRFNAFQCDVAAASGLSDVLSSSGYESCDVILL